MSDALRASDAEREHTVAALRVAAGEGRLTVDELAERTDRAYSAQTRGELTRLVHDLPAPPLPAPRPTRAPRLPGRARFRNRWRAPARPEEVGLELLRDVVPPLQAYGYDLVERNPQRLVFSYARRPAWTILVAIFAFPLGLLALSYKDREQVIVDLAPDGAGTVLVAHGTAPLAVRRAFAQLDE